MMDYYKMFVDAWRFFQKYSWYDGSDAASEKMIAAAHEVVERYHSKFFEQIITAIVGELERKAKKTK